MDARRLALIAATVAGVFWALKSQAASVVDAPTGEGFAEGWLAWTPPIVDEITDAFSPDLDPSMSATRASGAVYDRLRAIEEFSATPYADPAGQSKTYSIGYGYQLRRGEWYDSISVEFAEQLLGKVVGEVEEVINGNVRVPLSQNQYDALVMFVYNIGQTQFLHGGPLGGPSTLLRKLNAGDYAGAAAEFPRWNKAGGAVSNALVARRDQEQNLFLA